jgi:glycine cleavage system H lipoate-binding protein
MHLQTADIIQNVQDRKRVDLGPLQRQAVFRKYPNLYLEQKRQGDGEVDLQQEVMLLLKQASALKPNLSAELKERLKNMEDLAAKQRLQESFYMAVSKLRAQGYAVTRIESWKSANALQFQIAGNLRDLARALRKNPDAVAALREAQNRIDQAIQQQETIKKETKEQTPKNETAKADPNKLTFPGTEPLPSVKIPPKKPFNPVNVEQAKKEVEAAQKAADLGKKQAVLEFDTQGTENLVKPVAKKPPRRSSRPRRPWRKPRKPWPRTSRKRPPSPREKPLMP